MHNAANRLYLLQNVCEVEFGSRFGAAASLRRRRRLSGICCTSVARFSPLLFEDEWPARSALPALPPVA